ncbi:MAG TPA: hypothetical protein VF221_02800 [Chloroflexota bacterium]
MDPVLVVSLAFLFSPLLGYIVIILPLTTTQKIIVAAISVFLLVTVPLAVIYLTGSANGSAGAPIGRPPPP